MINPLGWAYPAGAENDRHAPWNQPEPETCETCGEIIEDDGWTRSCGCRFCEECERLLTDDEVDFCHDCEDEPE